MTRLSVKNCRTTCPFCMLESTTILFGANCGFILTESEKRALSLFRGAPRARRPTPSQDVGGEFQGSKIFTYLCFDAGHT